MKLSSETLGVLKNFSNINTGILFKKGKTLKTVSNHKNILAEVVIQEEIPVEFGIYDLNEFLNLVSLHDNDLLLEFAEKQMKIISKKGRSDFRFCEPTMITLPPEKQISMPDPEINFTFTAENFQWILRAASGISSPHITIESDGKKINIITLDLQNDSAHTNSLEISEGNGDKYRMIFKTENLTKILSGSYDVSISSKGISHFKNKSVNLQYWITTEAGSKFEKGA